MAGVRTQFELDETTYTIPALTNDQLERVMDTIVDATVPPHKRAFRLLPIIMEQAEPPIENGTVRGSLTEITAALDKVLMASGLKEQTSNPPQPLALFKTADA
jgi:hypothetical protein